MIALRSILRGSAAAIAVAAIVDPAVPFARQQRPAIRVVSGDAQPDVRSALAAAGFEPSRGQVEQATVLVSDRVADRIPASAATWVLDTSPAAPNVRLLDARASGVRLPGQATDVAIAVAARGVRGQSTAIVLEDHGLPVASARHTWQTDSDRWETHLPYLSAEPGSLRLRVRADTLPAETASADNVVDLVVPPTRGPVRTLVVEAGVTWPALFVRRALEGDPAFAVSTLQRAAKAVATRAGGPPAALDRDSLRGFEAAVVGGPEQLSAAEVDALRWFVETRGGIVLLVPDRAPSGRYTSLIGVTGYEERVHDTPVRVGSDLQVSELALARSLPGDAATLAADQDGRATVFAVRRGAGGVIFSGALDAWRHRDDAFARFWRQIIAAQAATVPPALAVEVTRSLVRPGTPVGITARVREVAMEAADRVAVAGLTARAIDPRVRREDPIRLWPTAEPGVFTGVWQPRDSGEYDVSVSTQDAQGDAMVVVAADAAPPAPGGTESLELLAAAGGGRLFPASRLDAMIDALKTAYPSVRVVRRLHVMRSAWWCVPFAALLCGEWAIRRRAGRP